MMKINELAPGDQIAAVKEMKTIEEVREAATSIQLTFSGNTGIDTLKQKITDAVIAKMDADDEAAEGNEPFLVSSEEDEEEIQIAKPVVPAGPSVAQLLKMDATQEPDPKIRRLIIRAQALKLVRVRITNLDPSDAMLEGCILSITTKYTGKQSKFIPFGDNNANGYHIPQMMYDHLKDVQFPLRKEIKGGQFGVKKYKTTMVKKYQIELLTPLTREEIAELAAHQRASNAIDRDA